MAERERAERAERADELARRRALFKNLAKSSDTSAVPGPSRQPQRRREASKLDREARVEEALREATAAATTPAKATAAATKNEVCKLFYL